MKSSGNTILVTGGGSGIGRGLARAWHDDGNRVIVAGRRRDALEETIAGRDGMEARVIDVDSAAGVAAFVRDLLADHPGLNVLVNNAGIMRTEDPTASRDLTDAEATIATNLIAPIRLIDALVDHLVETADSAIVNVTSGLAFVPFPSAATYSATKAAMHSYTVSLRQRLAGKVEVIELAPPGVQTDLTPGQGSRDGYLPLDDFIAGAMAQFRATPTPPEILVERAAMLRHAERDGTYDQALAMLGAL